MKKSRLRRNLKRFEEEVKRMMVKPICVKCGREMERTKIGIKILEKGLGGDKDEPYQIWSTDLYQCPECGQKVAVGFGDAPISYHFEKDFEKIKKEVEIEYY